MRKIGILNAGGDCAGLNAVISAAVRAGGPLGYEFIGFEKGWEGILSPMMYRPLTKQDVLGISQLGGTILKTTNKGRFAGKAGMGDINRIPDEVLQEAKDNLDSLGVEGLIVIGGDGTLSAAMQLEEKGVNIVGVPKTIDNDLNSTDKTFGFSTAVQVAAEALDKIHSTAASHDRTFIVECMGRNAGWITLYAGLAGGADSILLPEFPFSVERYVEYLRDRRERGHDSNVTAIAEGVQLETGPTHRSQGDNQEVHFSGASEALMNRIEEIAPGEFDMRHVVLGHTQRGGAPNAEDRMLAKRYGVAAMEAYDKGEFGKLVALKNNTMTTAPIKEAVDTLKLVTKDSYEYRTANTLGVFID